MRKFNCLFAFLSALLLLAACTGDEAPAPHSGAAGLLRLRFEGHRADFGPLTRAATEWTPGEQVYLLFTVGTEQVTALAVYHTPDVSDPTDTGWLVYPDAGLTPSLLAPTCQAFCFRDATLQKMQVEMDTRSIAYGQRAATCFYDDDGALVVQATMSPQTARVRFRGTPGMAFAVDGLSFLTGFDAATATLAAQSRRLSATVGADGYTPYYYVLLTDATERRLTLLLPGIGTATRVMESSTLQPASTGYITLPTVDAPGKWTITDPIGGDDFAGEENWDEGHSTNGTIGGDDFAGEENWDEGHATNGTVEGDDFASDENWDNSQQSTQSYDYDENWD